MTKKRKYTLSKKFEIHGLEPHQNRVVEQFRYLHGYDTTLAFRHLIDRYIEVQNKNMNHYKDVDKLESHIEELQRQLSETSNFEHQFKQRLVKLLLNLLEPDALTRQVLNQEPNSQRQRTL